MEDNYAILRAELMKWEVEELRRGLLLSLDSRSGDGWDEALTTAILDVLDEKDPPPPFPDKYEAYERFRRLALDEFGIALLPPDEG